MLAPAALLPASSRLGLFITFEGGEGVGKSTQIALLAQRLRRLTDDVVVTREPGGSARAEALRRLLLAGRSQAYGSFAESVLFAAARQDHVDRVIAPALARGAVLLCDRFGDSTLVYQGLVGRTPLAALQRLNCAATLGLAPDVTIVLDLPPGAGLERARERRESKAEAPDRFEAAGLDYHERVRAAFLAIAAQEPARCVLIEADGEPASVAARVWDAIVTRIPDVADHD